MKAILPVIALIALVLTSPTHAADPGPKHQIVVQFTSDGVQQHEAILNNVENLLIALNGRSDVHVITHGPGIGLVRNTNEAFAARMEKLTKQGVTFVACENTMKRKKIMTHDLLPFVKTIDSGVAEVVRQQEAGWSYLKGGY